jgi:type I restriction enzyme S subunit
MVSRPRHGLSLCAGGGGLDLGLTLAEPGYHTRAFVEWEDWPRAVLIAAQREGYFAPAPIWTDLRSFDARPFRGAFDAVLAGYPWARASLETLTSFAIGGAWGTDPSQSDRDSVEVRCIRGTELKNWDRDFGKTAAARCISPNSLERRSLKPGDLIVEISGGGPDQPVGRSVMITERVVEAHFPTPVICTNFFRRIELADATVAPFIDRFLQYDYACGGTIDIQSGSNNLRNLNFSAFLDKLIPIPPVPEQRRIVHKLENLSARSRKARAELDAIPPLVERYKLNFPRSVFRGEQTASFRHGNDLEPASLLLKRTAAPEQGRGGRKATDEIIPGKGGISVNDPGTELPEGWAWVPLLRLARQETGHTPSRTHPEWWGGDVCWVSIPDANKHHGQVIHDTIQKTNEAGLANSSARLLPEGTVVLSRTASVGYVTILGREMATSQDFATWTCSAALEPKYLMYALMSEGNDIRDFGEGSTHTTIYFPEIRAFNIKLAPLEEQREIVRRIEKAFGMVERITVEAERARKLVDRLDQRIFAKAFAGELVPQNPNDEPASALLERIRDAHANAPKKTRQKRTEVYAMKETPRDRLIADSSSWPENGLPFEDVAKRVLMPHDDLRDALFELLGGTTPVLEQVFDKTDERMRLKRATS